MLRHDDKSGFSYRVYLSQHCPTRKEQGFPGVHDDKVKVRLPRLFGLARLERRTMENKSIQ